MRRHTDLIAFAEAWHELVVQLVEVSQVTAAIQRPASRPQRTRLPLDYLETSTRSTTVLITKWKPACVSVNVLPQYSWRKRRESATPEWLDTAADLQCRSTEFGTPACRPAPVCSLLSYTPVSGSTRFQTESLRRTKISWCYHINADTQKRSGRKPPQTWAPEENELKVVLETTSVEHGVPEYRKMKTHRKERFIHHGNLQMYRKVWGETESDTKTQYDEL